MTLSGRGLPRKGGMVLGLGIDLVEIERFRRVLERHEGRFEERVEFRADQHDDTDQIEPQHQDDHRAGETAHYEAEKPVK